MTILVITPILSPPLFRKSINDFFLFLLYIIILKSKYLARFRFSAFINIRGRIIQFYFRYKELNSEYRLLLNLKKYGSYTHIARSYNIRDMVNSNFDKINKKRKAFKDQIYKIKEEKKLTRSKRKYFRI